MGDMPEVAVAAVAVGGVEGKIDTLGDTVVDLVLAGLEGPEIGHAPRSDDLQVRSQGLDAELEADLVVSFSGGAVADGAGLFLPGDLHQLFRDQRTRHAGAQEVLVFIDSTCLDAGHDVFLGKFIVHVKDVKL